MENAAFDPHSSLRFSWTVWPSSRQQASRIEIPLGCLYTPLHEDVKVPLVEYAPLKCRSGGSILNPYCYVDQWSKTWTCPFTGVRTEFPELYARNMAEKRLPEELQHATIEYILPHEKNIGGRNISGADGRGTSGQLGFGSDGKILSGNTSFDGAGVGAPAFVLVLDTCMHEEELSILKDSIQQSLSLMPPDSLIGLITFGTMCNVHELGFTECPKSYVFRGNAELTELQIQQQLGIAARNDPRGAASRAAISRFLLPVSECELIINSILDDLQGDSWPSAYDERQRRCTGVALSVAVALLGCCCNHQSARALLFVGGACTVGPGKVVDVPLSESIRHHQDLQKENNNARFVKKALKFYTGLALRAVANGHAIDIFCGSLDQCGLYEMRVCCEKTGGYAVMSDSFGIAVFKDTFKKMFETDANGYLKHGYNARIEVFTSPEFKVCGAIGTCASSNKKGSQIAESVIGEGNTCEWLIGALDKRTTLAFYFEVTNANSNQSVAKQSHLQFQTLYHHPSGRRRLRVTTVSYRYAEASINDLSPGFDQEAAAVLMARLAVFKTETAEALDVLRWLDRKLVRLVSEFANFQKNNPQSFHLSSEFANYPQFMYNLRRSHFLQTFNASPDEIAYYRTVLLREDVLNSLVMMQPALLMYSFESPYPQPVFLDAQSLKPDAILLLDSFFHIIVWHGELISRWQELGYDDNPEYSNFKGLLQSADNDAAAIIEERFPVPKFIKCKAGGSQARFLLAKVNPSTTHNTLNHSNWYGPNKPSDSSAINTDDVSLSVFMDHLIKLAVHAG